MNSLGFRLRFRHHKRSWPFAGASSKRLFGDVRRGGESLDRRRKLGREFFPRFDANWIFSRSGREIAVGNIHDRLRLVDDAPNGLALRFSDCLAESRQHAFVDRLIERNEPFADFARSPTSEGVGPLEALLDKAQIGHPTAEGI